MGRCRRHPNHIIVGICAYCLNNRLLALLKEDQEEEKYNGNHEEADQCNDSDYACSSSVCPSPIYSRSIMQKSRKSTTVLDDFRQIEAKSISMGSSSIYHPYSVYSSPCYFKSSSDYHFFRDGNAESHTGYGKKTDTKKKKKPWLHLPFLQWNLSSNERCDRSHGMKQAKGKSNYTIFNNSLREVHDSLSKGDVSSLLSSPNVSRQCASQHQCSSPIITNGRGSNKIHRRSSSNSDRKNWYDNGSYISDGNLDIGGNNIKGYMEMDGNSLNGHVGYMDANGINHINRHVGMHARGNGHVTMDANGIYHIDGHVGMDANGIYLVNNHVGMNASSGNGHVGIHANHMNGNVAMKTKLNGHVYMYGSHMNRDLDMNSNGSSNKNVGYMNANDDDQIHRNVPMDGGNNRSHDINRHLSMVKSKPQSPPGIHRDVSLASTPSRLSSVSAYSPDAFTRRKPHLSEKDIPSNHRSACANNNARCVCNHNAATKYHDKQTKRNVQGTTVDNAAGFKKEFFREPYTSSALSEKRVPGKSPLSAGVFNPSAKRLQSINLSKLVSSKRSEMVSSDCGRDVRVSPIPTSTMQFDRECFLHDPRKHPYQMVDDRPRTHHHECSDPSKYEERSTFSVDAALPYGGRVDELRSPKMAALKLRFKQNLNLKSPKHEHASKDGAKEYSASRWSKTLSRTLSPMLSLRKAKSLHKDVYQSNYRNENDDDDDDDGDGDGDDYEKQSSQSGLGIGSFMKKGARRVNHESQIRRNLVLSALEGKGPPQNYSFLNKDYSAFTFYFSSRG